MSKGWAPLRERLGAWKRNLFDRPMGLKSFGLHSAVRWPRRIETPQCIAIGSGSFIRPHSYLSAITHYAGREYSPSIRIGNQVYIGGYVYLSAITSITISDGCVLAENVYIADQAHGYDPEAGLIMEQELQSKGPVFIGPHCFLGFRVAVMPGVSLGEHCVVGANSVVTRSFPPFSMIAGSPARLMKSYDHNLKAWVSPTEFPGKNNKE
jgi:acetyltransferase-like isoleucine patch superfamily enzyme